MIQGSPQTVRRDRKISARCWVLIGSLGISTWIGCGTSSGANGPDTAAAQPVSERAVIPAEHVCPLPAPEEDGWSTEAFSETAGRQLNTLLQWMLDPSVERRQQASAVLEAGIRSQLGEFSREAVFDDGSTRVDEQRADAGAPRMTGREPFLAQLESWLRPVRDTHDPHGKFKVLSVQIDEDHLVTEQHLSLSGFGDDRGVQLQGYVRTVWRIHDDQPPRIAEWSQRQFSAVSCRAGEPWFRDRTRSLLRDADRLGDLQQGLESWMDRREGFLTGQFGHHGLAVGDVNSDGREDIYVCQPGGLANLLLVQQANGSVRDEAAAAGVDFLDLSRAALLVDLDNDSDSDLVLATSNRLAILKNDGKGRFSPSATCPQVRDANSLAAADVDRDGDLDVYVCVYSRGGDHSRDSPTPVPIHDARNGGRNVLLRNDSTATGKFEFTDVTAALGLDENNDRWSYAAAFEDYDDDGDLDLFVANDFGRNNLYRQDEGHYHDVAATSGLGASAFGMSVAWGDFDRDGRRDIYVGNMFSGAGHRVTEQPQFQAHAPADVRLSLRNAAHGNALYRNLGDGTFQNVAEAADVAFGRWAWGSVWADLNHDGWEDILVANGFVTSSDPDDL